MQLQKTTIWGDHHPVSLRTAARILGCRYDTLRRRLRIMRDRGVTEVTLKALCKATAEYRVPNCVTSPSVLRSPMAQFDETLRRKEMRPISMRLTALQYERLLQARAQDGLSLQEHARRALDLYLAQLDKHRLREAQTPGSPPPGVAPRELAPMGAMTAGAVLGSAAGLSARQERPKIARR